MALLHNHKITISGTDWDYSLGNLAEILLTADITITVSNSSDMLGGLLKVTQDGTGGWQLTLPGNTPDDLEIVQGAGGVTLLSFININGTIYWSMAAEYTP